MANKKISDLDAITAVGDSDLMQIAQNGAWKKLTPAQLKDYCNPVETVEVTKEPYLSDSGSLMVYDDNTSDFVDTGIKKSVKDTVAGKKWLVIGDGMSFPNGTWSGTLVSRLYYDLISSWTGLTTDVHAVSGTGYWAGSDTSTSFLDRVAALDYSDVDMITIFGSCNDWGYVESDTNLGAIGDTGTTTLYGRIYQTLNTLITNNPYKPIGVITTLPRKTIYGTMPTAYQVKAVKAVVDVAEYFGLPVLDIYGKSGLRPWVRDANDTNSMFADNIHPNNSGHYVLAQQIYAWMMDNLCWFGGSTT